MLTLLAIVLLVVLGLGLACMVNALINGSPLAWLWYLCGGMESTLEVMGLCVKAIIEGLGSIGSDS
jgi:ABC-type sugar transport system permease subunit